MRKEGEKENKEKLEILVITEMSMREIPKSTFIETVVEWILEQIINESKKSKIVQGYLFKRVGSN